jgi:hypothetical protein
VVNFNLEYFDAWLFYCKICHLNVETVEMNTLHTLIHSLGEASFAYFADANGVRHGAELVELSEKIIEVNLCS